MMVVPASTSVEERRILRELQKKFKLLDEVERLRVAGDPESLRASREHLVTRKKVWAAYCDLRDKIQLRMRWPG
jgi:hypothetical protein